jgi:hypothetical protein
MKTRGRIKNVPQEYVPPTPEQLNDKTAKYLDNEKDYLIATDDQLPWLIAQLANWPIRMDERYTTNARFLMNSAAATLRARCQSNS